MGTPNVFKPGIETDTFVVAGTELALPGVEVMTTDTTEQRSLPPGDSTTIFTIPVEVDSGAEMVGPGMMVDGGRSQVGTGGNSGKGAAPGAGGG